jgi:LPS-assembly protein
MKNKFIYFFCILVINFFLVSNSFSAEEFNFDVTEAEIIQDGKVFLGRKGGIVTADDGTTIEAINFDYDKSSNILVANENVQIDDKIQDIKIFTDKITYLKNKEIVITEGKSKAISNEIIINAHKFEYNKITNILIATGNVEIDDKAKDIKIFTDKITYLKNEELLITDGNSKVIDGGITINANQFTYYKFLEKINAKKNVIIEDKIENFIIYAEDITYLKNKDEIFTKGRTNVIFQSNYDFLSKDVTLNRYQKELRSSKDSILKDGDSTLYKLSKFIYFYDKKLLKGEEIETETNYLTKESDKLYFSEAFIDFTKNKHLSKDTKILLHKKIFDNEREPEDDKENFFSGQNDPRISGVSSRGNEKEIILDKAIFTSCKKTDKCPPWSIKADKITHDRVKQNIDYKNAVVNVYDVPVFYFPKFFHPDPTVKRRSGLLQPRLNDSDILGTSFNMPYFHVISQSKDLTFKPTIFDNRIYMFQNEYRQENENSSFIADFNYIKGYKSKSSNNRNSISHLFSKFNIDLGLKNFIQSKLNIFVEKVNNDTYLKIFENVLLTDKKFEEDLKDKNNLTSGFELLLDHEKYNFTSGLTIFENLQKLSSDRYQYIFPYYDFSTSIFANSKGSLDFSSNGRNTLSNTNNLKSNITNNLNYTTNDLFTKTGFVNNYGIYFKNLNVMAKNDDKYKSSLQNEIINIYEVNTNYPLLKIDEKTRSYITPKISFRINPSDMKNYSSEDRLLTTDNIFDIGRLGLSDSYESGKSITLGIDYKREDRLENDKFLEIKLASILRDKREDKIPTSSSANRTTSNLFGSIENSFSEFLTLNYDFALDNNYNKFEHNRIEAEFTVNNFVTKFNFLEMNGEMGDTNTLENITQFNFDESNSLMFKTRRNRKISLTEYYDLVYEYQNDCLTAAIKYRKTYYQDRDLRAKEDLFFTITLFPFAEIDQQIDESAWRGDNAIQNLFK